MPFVVSSSGSLKCIMTVDFVWVTPSRNDIRYFADEEKNQFMESNRGFKVNNVFKCITTLYCIFTQQHCFVHVESHVRK